ncbi:MAG: hypothetical protein ACOC93_03035, partial [Planctomycetota bacterium]
PTWNVSTNNGTFSIDSFYSGERRPAEIANGWLDALDGEGGSTPLYALVSDATQNQAIPGFSLSATPVTVPVPPAAFGGAALLGLLGAGQRLRKRFVG